MSLTKEQKLSILLQEIDDGNEDYEMVIINLYNSNCNLLEVCSNLVRHIIKGTSINSIAFRGALQEAQQIIKKEG